MSVLNDSSSRHSQNSSGNNGTNRQSNESEDLHSPDLQTALLGGKSGSASLSIASLVSNYEISDGSETSNISPENIADYGQHESHIHDNLNGNSNGNSRDSLNQNQPTQRMLSSNSIDFISYSSNNNSNGNSSNIGFPSPTVSKRANSADNVFNSSTRIKRKKPSWSSGSTFKLLKACNFCRKRKIKCVIKANSNICESCKYHKKEECVFDHKAITNSNSNVINHSSKNNSSQSASFVVTDTTGTSSNAYNSAFPSPQISGAPSSSINMMSVSNASQVHLPTRDSSIVLSNSTVSSPPSPPVIKNSPNSTGMAANYKATAPSPTASMRSTSLISIDGSIPSVTHESPSHKSPASVHFPGDEVSPSSMPLTNNTKSARQSLFELYQSNIEPYTPFVPYEVFHTNNYRDLDQFSKCCINIATVSSPNNKIPESAIELFLEFLNNFLSTGTIVWNETTLACFLLMPLRISIDTAIIEKSLLFFNELYEADPDNISINLVIGAMTIDAYYSMFHDSKLTTNPRILKRSEIYLNSLSEESFNYHFLYVGFYIYKMIWLSQTKELSFSERKYKLFQLEFDMLLWPAKLTTDLSVVKDKLLATPEAFILHVLHNTLLCAYYTRALQDKEVVGKMISISPVPGLYHFISGMAKSNFRVTNAIVGRWSIIANCRVQTAKLLLDLNNIMDFDPFKQSLRLFSKKSNVKDVVWQDRIYDRVQHLLHESPVEEDDDDVDGAVVFWVFRDIRSMSLQTYIKEEKERRTSMGVPPLTP